MKRALILSVLASIILAGNTHAAGVPDKNLCYNGDFENKEDALAGWMHDYAWTGNSNYIDNKTRIKVLPSYQGKRNVMHINGASKETKVESKPFKYEQGARYRCTYKLSGTTQPHAYFAGYKWNPGIRPHDDPEVGELRKIYKSQFRNAKVSGSSGGWKTVTFDFPLPDDKLSKKAKYHLRYVRMCTIYIIVVDTGKGHAYIDDVVVTKIR